MAEKRFSKSEQVLAVVAVAVIALYFFMGRVYDPLSSEMKKAIKAHNRLVATVNRLNEEPVSTAGLEKSIRRVSVEVDGLRTGMKDTGARLLATGEQVEELVVLVDSVAVNNALMVKGLKPCESTGLDPRVKLEMTHFGRQCYQLKLSGDFLDFCVFLEEVARLQWMVNFSELEVDGLGGGLVDVEMVLVI